MGLQIADKEFSIIKTPCLHYTSYVAVLGNPHMQKKLIALAVAGMLAAPTMVSAQTTVTIFGRVQAEYSGVHIHNHAYMGPGTWYYSGPQYQGSVEDNSRSSRWGLQITENLGNGLKAHARMEMGLNTGSGSASTPREQWVGLSGTNWGEVKFGRVQSPFKDFAGGMTIDPFAYTSLQANGAGGSMSGGANGLGSGANGFVNSAIRFDSATVEGFSVAALFMPGDANSLDPTNSGNISSAKLPGGLGASGNTGGRNGEFDGQVAAKYTTNYMGHDLSLFGGYSRDNANNAQRSIGLRTEEVWRAGAIWEYGNLRLSGQYERVYNAIGSATCTTAASLTASPVGYGQNGQCNSAMNAGANGNIWHFGTQYRWSSTLLVVQGGGTHADEGGINAGLQAAQPLQIQGQPRQIHTVTVGAIHNLSKRTSLFGGYQRVLMTMTGSLPGDTTHDGAQPYYGQGVRQTWTLGLRHNF
jgi:GBP family porin